MKRLIEWDSLDVRVDGTKLNEIMLATVGVPPPIERMSLRFENGLLRVEGSIRKFISIPFTVEITRILAKGTTVTIPLGRISAAGLPVPTILLDLFKKHIPRDVMEYKEPATFVMSLERFLPPFVSADIQKIWIIDGGLAVTLGRGGADLPTGGTDGNPA
ncbi:MAG TPA: hypothetical protein VMU84_06910 [Thermoanaerobaculia bacterium]|nr:hypothetical protein [Thermoanaerobaculia bacterium]